MKIVVLPGLHVNDRVFLPDHLERLRAEGDRVLLNPDRVNPTAERAAELVSGADAVITSWGCPRLDAAILNQAPNLRIVLHAAGSVKAIASPVLAERGIQVVSAASVLSRGVGETALGLTITSLKNIWEVSAHTKQFGWWGDRKDEVRDRVREMYGSTIGCIGAGHAGRHYLKLLRAFSVNNLLYDPTLSDHEAAELGASLVSLETLFRSSDVVTVLAPEIPETYRMVNAERLAMMKDGAVLINLARGSLIDEVALVKELESGRLRACLDVTDPEPPVVEHPFRLLPNVVLTGHIAGAVNNGLHAIGDFIIEEWMRYRQGERLEGKIDLAKLHVSA